MSSPVIFSRLHQLRALADYQSLPQAVLIDVGPEMEAFLSTCYDCENFEASLDDMINDILVYVVDTNLAEEGLQAFYDDVLSYHRREHHGVSPEAYAEALVAFARGILDKLRQLGMYTTEGLLPYVLKSRIAEQTLYLERYAEEKFGIPKMERNMKSEKIHHTMGLYADESRKHNGVASVDLANHIKYNKTMRPGRALFVDGKCVYPAWLDAAIIAKTEAELATEPKVMTEITAPYQ